MIDRQTAEKIKDTADIVEVVSDYVHLVRRGANYMGLCPFHNERTPSFSVNKRKNFCYCFSCHKGGSPVNFIMEKEGLSYHDALLHLAKKYGIPVEERELTDEERRSQNEREAMLVANEWAMKKMESDMRSTDEGRDVGLQYFYQRGVTDEAIREFHLGYALDSGYALTDAAAKSGFDLDVLKTVGLVGTSRQGRDYDRFQGRVIFPVLNSSGKVVAFGGRDLKGGMAKYINSPESQIYKKSNELYGIYQARQDIVRLDKCYLVEGYMDVIGMWQSGMRNVIASSGTALTDGQINLIHRFTNNVTLIYDGDAAGIKASLRGIDMLLAHRLEVKVLLLPDGDDPDSFARKHTPEEFKEYVDSHETDIIRFKIQVLIDEAKDDPGRKAEAVRSVVQSIAVIPDRIKRDVYVQECARLMDMPEETIMEVTRQQVMLHLEEERRRREHSRIDRDEAISSEPAHDVAATPVQNPPAAPQPVKTVQKPNPFYQAEKTVVEYAVKYGFMDLYSVEDDAGNTVTVKTLEYIREELENDGLEFSVKVFGDILNELEALYAGFNDDAQRFIERIEPELTEMRQRGFDEIASRNLDMASIESEERKLEERIKAEQARRLTEFTRDYPSSKLISHEDGDIRNVVNGIVSEPYQLSNIYIKQGNIESDEDRLIVLLPRAITEWKTEILEQRLQNAMRRLAEIQSAKADDARLQQEEIDIQREIGKIIGMRAQIAKNIGERILSPRLGSLNQLKK